MKKLLMNKNSKFRNVLEILKWVILVSLLWFSFQNFDLSDFQEKLQEFTLISIFLYLVGLLFSRILYSYRWFLLTKIIIKKPNIPFLYIFQTNLLAEFVSIVLPTSLGGEVTRVLKLNARGNRTTLSTAAVLLDRILGISGMLAVSLLSLAMIGEQIKINLIQLLPERLILPLIILLVVLALGIAVLGFFWLRNPVQRNRLKQAWDLVRTNLPIVSFAFLVSMVAHVVFSLAHYFLFREIYHLGLIEVVAVILTPQLARSIPISVLGISAGEGMMVLGQIMIGMPRESALAVTLIALAGRYFFGFVGFLFEFLHDGIHFFKQVRSSQDKKIDE